MATSKQEQLYNRLVEYYSFADDLISATESNTHELSNRQFMIIEEIVTKLEECADKLTTQYIEFVKNGNSDVISKEINGALDEITAKIEETEKKILTLYSTQTQV